jgi:hypothetical protein
MDGLTCVVIEDMLYRIGPGGTLICVSMNFLRTRKTMRMKMPMDVFNSKVYISVCDRGYIMDMQIVTCLEVVPHTPALLKRICHREAIA